MSVHKIVFFDKQAEREINRFPDPVQAKIKASIDILERDGKLNQPYAKKIDNKLFEIRIQHKGQWRILYAYLVAENIIILSAFHKKSRRAPIKEINKARARLVKYK